MSEQLQHWEQREAESSEAFAAFETYRLMGQSRSLAKTAAQLGKSVQLIEQWAAPRRHEWRKRVLAWDRHEARYINNEVLAGTAAMRQRLTSHAISMQLRAASVIQDMTPDDLRRLTPAQIVAFFKAGADVEMKARAIPVGELEADVRAAVPTFTISFIPSKPDGMVSVRLSTGEAGCIPAERVDEFLADNVGSVAIR